MKRILTLLIVMIMTPVVVFTPVTYAQGPACTNRAIAGTYSFTCNGWTPAGPGGSLVPMMEVGVATGDASGHWSGAATVNIGGQTIIPNAILTGQTEVNSNCSGNIVYNQGEPTELNINYVANLKTDEIFGLILNGGTVASCELRRMSR